MAERARVQKGREPIGFGAGRSAAAHAATAHPAAHDAGSAHAATAHPAAHDAGSAHAATAHPAAHDAGSAHDAVAHAACAHASRAHAASAHGLKLAWVDASYSSIGYCERRRQKLRRWLLMLHWHRRRARGDSRWPYWHAAFCSCSCSSSAAAELIARARRAARLVALELFGDEGDLLLQLRVLALQPRIRREERLALLSLRLPLRRLRLPLRRLRLSLRHHLTELLAQALELCLGGT